MTADNLNIEAIYPLTPVQDGILFHTLYAPEAPLYIQQYTCRIEGTLDVDLFQQSWQQVVDPHMCVSSTARAALDHGYRVTIPASAVATRDLPAPDGATMKAADITRYALTELADRFAIITPDVMAVPD